MRVFILFCCAIVIPLAKSSGKIPLSCGSECPIGIGGPMENTEGFNNTNNATQESINNVTKPVVIWNGTIKPIENTAGFAPDDD
ncbi:hypothetical protein Q5P01_004262 [Channa striata]|uniref:Uncharacterized protein n=1 Tax=Channa striata TaxID=64152 RepID=A0AA88NJ40_CHASR|nr:hypothetical protein Q5P01_004262 [Channa striata]